MYTWLKLVPIAAAMMACLGQAHSQPTPPRPMPVLPTRPPQSTILIMPVPQATLDMLGRGLLKVEFTPEVLDSVLRGAYGMPSRPSLPPLPRPPSRVAPDSEVQPRLLTAPLRRPNWRLVIPELLPRPAAKAGTVPRP